MAYSTVTLTGRRTSPSGRPHRGYVTVEPSVSKIIDGDGNVVLSGRSRVDLVSEADATEATPAGSFSIELPATDDAGLNPTGFTYLVRVVLHDGPDDSLTIDLPAAVPVVDLADKTEADPSAPTYTERVNEATVAAEEAALSASSATTSASQAADSASAAAASSDAAATSALQAASSATSASDSATAASTSASDAQSAAASAATDVQAHLADEVTAAEVARTGAEAAQTAAASSAAAADADRVTAEAAANDAASSATAANTSADAAAQSAIDAATNAGLSGAGSPEGVKTAPVGTRYIDTAATNGAVEWMKATGSGNTGWRVHYGTTGRRYIDALLNGWANSNSLTGLTVCRDGNRVTVTGQVSKATATGAVFYTLPLGFRPAGTRWASGALSGGGGSRLLVEPAGHINAVDYASMTNAPPASVNLTFDTADPWPTTLPGVAS